MSRRILSLGAALVTLVLFAGVASAADKPAGLDQTGTPDIKSAGPLGFGPDGVLFVGDPQGAAIFAIDTGDTKATGTGAIKVQGINAKIASLLGTDAQAILINDLAVNPASGNAFLSVSRGKGPDAKPAIIKVEVASDKKSVRLWVDGLQEGHIHDLTAPALRSADGEALLHPQAYYTLNYIPAAK